MAETSHFEDLDPFIIGNNENPERRYRQYDLYVPQDYIKLLTAIVRQKFDDSLKEQDAFPIEQGVLKITRLGFPIAPEKIQHPHEWPPGCDKDNMILLKDAGVVVCNKTGPKLVHVTRDDLFLGNTPLRPAGGALYLSAWTDEGRIEYNKFQAQEGRQPRDPLIKDGKGKREWLRARVAGSIAGDVVEDLRQQIARRGNDTSWLYGNNELFPISISNLSQRHVGFEPFGRTFKDIIPKEAIDPGLNAIQREGVLRRIAWIDDLFAQAARLIKAYLNQNFGALLGDISQRQRLAAQHGIGAQDVPVAGVSFATPPIKENGILSVSYLPYVSTLPRDRIQESLELLRKEKADVIEKFLQTKNPFSKIVDAFNI